MKNIQTSGNTFKSKNKYIRKLAIICPSVVVLTLIVSFVIVKCTENKGVTIKQIERLWDSNPNKSFDDYQQIYDLTKEYLVNDTFNNKVLTYHAYSCFYLAVSQTDSSIASTFYDEAISNMRIALYDAKNSLKPQLYYMLGKTYYYKNTISSYYYADLAIKYLQLAQENGYKADDIPLFLGMCFAELGDYQNSISTFSEALRIRESDVVLFSIAEQYYKAGQLPSAKQYLFRIQQNSEQEDFIERSSILLGNIYTAEGKYQDALEEFQTILKKNKNSADAYYGIGVIYEKQGDLVRARSEWRKAIKIQVNHPGAAAKLSEK